MRGNRTTGKLILPTMLILAAGQVMPVQAQETGAAPAPAPTGAPGEAAPVEAPKAEVPVPASEAKPAVLEVKPAQPEGKPAPAAPPEAPAADRPLSFNFKNTPWDMVVDFMARQTGLPVIQEAAPPAAPVTFISGSEYTLEESLDIVNRMLWMHGLQLRREGNYLLLSKLEDAKARSRQFVGQVPESVGAADIVTLVLPLNNSTATLLSEKLSSLVTKGIGAITALPQQNALIVVDTAAQARRVHQIVSALDSKPAADSEFKLFPLKHAEAAAVFQALKGLVAEKQTTVVIDKDGGRRVVQEENFQGISIQPDARTNSIIAVGPSARLRTVEEVVALLDVEGGEAGHGSRELVTFTLGAASPDEAAQKIGQLFQSEPARTRPTVLPLTAQGKISIVGSPAQTRQAAALLAELDPDAASTALPGGVRAARSEAVAWVVPLKHVRPDAAQAVLSRLLSARQAAVLRFVPAPDGKGLIASGPTADVEMLSTMLRAIDVEPKSEREVRQVRVSAGDPAELARKVNELYGLTGRAEDDPVTVIVDAESRTITLAGSRGAIATTSEMLRSAQQNVRVDRETRTLDVTKSRPSEVVPALARLARSMLEPRDGSEYVAPEIEAVDELGKLIVRALPEQFKAIEEAVSGLDGVAGSGSRQVRLIELRNAKAPELAGTLRDMAASVRPLTGEAGPAPAVEAVPAINAILVVGQPAQMTVVEQLARNLDARSAPERPPLRILRVETTDAAQLAATLSAQYAARPNEQRAAQPVEISADSVTNTLLVAAHPEVFPEIEKLVTELNGLRVFDARGREIRIFPLKHAQAEELARTIDQMYPEPPMPVDPRTRQPLPERRPPKEVVVRADRTTNSLIVDATLNKMGAFEALVKQLDSQQVTASVEVRTYRVQRAQLDAAANAIRSVIASGAMPGVGAGQLQAVHVSAEPVSRSLIITAPAEAFAGIEKILGEIDTQPERPATDLRVFTLTGARAEAVAAVLRPVLVGRARELQGAGGGAGWPGAGVDPATLVEVAGDPTSNVLIVSAPRAVLESAAEIVRALDEAALTSNQQMRMIPIDRSRADAKLVAETLQRMLEQRGGVKVEVISADELLKRTGGEKKDPKPGAMRDSSGDRGLPVIARTIVASALSWAGEPEGTEGAGRMPAAPAVQPDAPAAAPAAADAPNVTIAVDPVSNSLIVVGGARAIDQVAALAAEIQRQAPAEPTSVRIVQLPELSDARAISNVLNAIVNQLGRESPDNPGGMTGRVTIQTDPEATSLVISANATDFRVVSELLVAFMDPGATESRALTVKVYPLQNVSAGGALQAARDLFRSRPEGFQARRVRSLALAVPGADGAAATPVVIDPSTIGMTADPSGTSLIVAAPAPAIGLLDRFIALIDQSPQSDRLAIRVFELKNAKASEAARTMQAAMDAVRQGMGGSGQAPGARYLGDDRTNSILVTGSEAQLRQTEKLLAELDRPLADDGSTVTIIPLQVARPSTVQRIVEAVVAGRDPGRQGRLVISASDDASLFVFRGTPEQAEEVKRIVSEVDRQETAGALPVRSIKLERADAVAVSASLRQFFDQRAEMNARPGQRRRPGIAIVGDRRSATLVVAAPDDDFAQVQSLVERFDAPAAARDLKFLAVPLAHARVSDIKQTVEAILNQLRWTTMTAAQMRADGPPPDLLVFDFDERTNSVVMIGQGDNFEQAERIIRSLDTPAAPGAQVTMRAVRIEHADPRVVASAVAGAMNRPGRPWQSSDVEGVRVEVDARTRTIVLIGRAERLDLAQGYVAQLDRDVGQGREMATLTLRYAAADRVAQSLTQFFRARAAPGAAEAGPTLIGLRDGNVLIASGVKEDLDTVRGLLETIDQPPEGEGRTRELFTLRNSDAAEVANTLREQFPRTLAAREGLVIVTPQMSTNSLMVSAPGELFDRVAELVRQLDQPPTSEATRIVTVTLSTARAEDVAASLTAALPKTVKVRVTPVRRTNSLLLTGSDEAIRLVSEQIDALDAQPTRAQEFVRLKLEHADAGDVALTLRQLMGRRQYAPGETPPAISSGMQDNTLLLSAAPDQLDELRRIVSQLDTRDEAERTTEFVALKFADAEQTARALEVFYGRFAPEAATPGARNVTVIANPVSRSLVISADQGEWPGIRALLEKLDNEQYDTSRRLEIVALKHADATSLARALSESFAAPLQAQLERERARQQERRQRGEFWPEAPSTLIDAMDRVTVTAEPLTNSLIIGAAREQVERIRALIAQLDVPDSARLPEARVIPLRIGPASQIAQSLRSAFAETAGAGGRTGPRSLVIVGEDKSNTLIIRCEESQFAQIAAMAESLQQEGDKSRAQVRVLALKHVPAARVALTIRTTFANVAREGGETLAVEVDRTTNALVIASSEKIFEQVKRVAEELDALQAGAGGAGDGAQMVPGLGQTVQIVDIENNAPADIARLVEQLGVTRPPPADRPGIVSEPVTVTVLSTRRALAVAGSPQDIIAVAALVKALDASPTFADQQTAVVRLRAGQAQQVTAAIQGMLRTAAADASSAPARALLEQIRRLNIQRDPGDNGPAFTIDLARPIHILAEAQTNSIVVSSSKENVAALRELVSMLDKLPIGEAITVRLYPLKIASAQRLAIVIRELFAQADRLRTLPGTQIRGEPTTASGRSLMSPVAVTVDDRTNTLIIAAQEDAVALVEVMVSQLDTEKGAGWVEPAVIRLEHADARRMAQTLNEVFVRGLRETPEAAALQRAVGRLSILQEGKDPSDPASRLQSDLFAGMSTLVVTAQDATNALVVVGSTANISVIRELVKMLDVPAASAANTVRLFTLQFAAADRVAGMLREIFRQQVQTGTLRAEDDVAITSDVRTNSVVISTSPRSFAIVESLIKQLDGDGAHAMVNLHVIPVGQGNAAQLAPRIAQLMRERIDSAARAGGIPATRDTFSIQAEPSTNSLIVACSDENLAIVRQLVEVLGRGAEALAAAQVLEVIPVRSARVDQIAEAVRQLYAEKAARDRGPDAVRITPDQRLNALVVTGTPTDIEAIRVLVTRLDGAPVTAVTEIKRIELKKTDCVEVVRLLQNVLAGRSIAGGGSLGQRQALVLRFVREQREHELGRAPTEAEISGAVHEQVTLTPEPRTNSVVVNAPSQLMVLIESLVNDIDTSAAGAREIEIFELQHADARAMATVLRELFNLRQQGNSLVLVPERSGDVPAGDGVAGPPAPGEGTFYPTLDERQQLSITVDARTNSLIVSATKEYIEEVRKVVMRLDAREINERENLTVRLRNAKAPEAATTLRSYFREESDRVRQLLGPDRVGSLVGQLEREVVVQGDEKSNSLLVSVSPRYREKVAAIIAEIDSTPPQVLIQVLLAEVTLDQSGQFGVEARVGPFGGDMYGGTFLGAGSPIGTALGVPNFSVSSIDFELLVRALEAQGRLEVLSRPQLTVRNNENARFQVGENIGLADSVETFSNGNTQTRVRREDVGIILVVTPSVSEDGYIRMEVKPEISALSDRVTQITENVQSSIITRRQVETVVTVKDGETIVLGGLIQNREEERKTKVPGLGDIPLLGELFKSNRTSQTKTELLVLLTPRVIRSSEPGSVQFERDLRDDEIRNLSKPGELMKWLPTDPPNPDEPPADPSAPPPERPEGRRP
ncbi:MAG: secretin N-terminal domain-containing protein [Phycisphaerales bacterium]